MRLTSFTDDGLRMPMRMTSVPEQTVSSPGPLEAGQPLVARFGAGGDSMLDGRCRVEARLQCAEEAILGDLERSRPADITLAARQAA